MTKALFRKQMMEVFSWVYKNRKTGKNYSRKGIVGNVVLYVVVFGILAIMFAMMAVGLCKPLLDLGMGWLYWCIMGLVAIFMGVFGSVFNTYSSLYEAKDNDLLLAMPIPAPQILLVRLSGVYAIGLMYELLVMVPSVVVWFLFAPFHLLGAVNAVLIPIVLSLVVLVLSAILGWVVALVMTKVRRKNLITVFISLVFIVGYYYVYGQAYAILQSILINADAMGEKMKTFLYPLYQMGLAAEGNALAMVIFTVINGLLMAVTYYVLSRSFLKLATTKRSAAKVAYREKAAKAASLDSALFRKELRRFLGSANYMLNCGLGILLMPIAAVLLAWKGADAREILSMFPTDLLPLIGAAGICMISSMNDMAAPSVSLEGKNLWIVKSMPVPTKRVLLAKLKLHISLTVVPAIPLLAVVEWILKPDLFGAIAIPVVVLLFILMMAAVGLFANLKMPNLDWSSEVVPIKQSAPVTIALFGGWIVVGGLVALFFAVGNYLSPTVYLVLSAAVLAVITVLLLRWIFTRGVRIFETL